MGILVDVIIIVIILISVLLAYKKGFAKLAVSLFAFLIAIILMFLLYRPISNLVINTTYIDETIENAIYEKVNEVMESGDSKNAENVDILTESVKNNTLPQTAHSLSIYIVQGGVMILLYIVIRIVLRFISALTDLITKLPVLKQINKAGGIMYGLLRGILIVYVALLIINVVGSINPSNSIHQNIEESTMGKMMYDNNILNVFFK